ncbi:VWA domain-containing protein [Lentisphaerota bacterium ZTH]|nr:VWA domain-containing protein [Lentisphaerota bacterium]WET06361.1 VWA domain-containing protein [Lentisphaerota bacterium ZTH]
MTFAYPWVLFCYIPLLLIGWYVWKRKPQPSLQVSTTKPFKAANGSHKGHVSRIPVLLYLAASAVLVLALARPQRGIERIVIRAKGIDIILAIDLSGSMQAMDVPGDISNPHALKSAIESGKVKDRLDVAKQEIRRFVKQRPNDRIGLIGFARFPYTICPPTLDHAWLLAHLNRLQPGMIGDATGISGPIASAVYRLKKSDARRRVMVLFTDGANNVAARVSPRQASKLAREFNVVIYTVGIGSDNAFVMQDTFMGPRFIPVRGAYDTPLLKDIAKNSDGQYYSAADAEGLREVMSQINKMEKTTVEQPKFVDYKEFAPLLAALSLVLFLLGFVAENSLFLSVP